MFLWMIVAVHLNGSQMYDASGVTHAEFSEEPKASTVFFKSEQKCTQGLVALANEYGGTITFARAKILQTKGTINTKFICVKITGLFIGE